MSKSIKTPLLIKRLERGAFGVLLGVLASAALVRLLTLAYEVHAVVLFMLLLIGAVSGGFVSLNGIRSADMVNVYLRTWNANLQSFSLREMLRRYSLRGMLWMLALAAVVGSATVMTSNYDTLGRVTATLIATATVAGLLWPLYLLAEGKFTQAAGSLAMVCVLIVYLLMLPEIWGLGGQDGKLMFTSRDIVLLLPFGMLFLYLKNFSATWISARVGFVVYLTVLASFLVTIWHPDERGPFLWWSTGRWSAVYGALSVASLCGMRRLTINWRWMGVGAAFLAWVLMMLVLWGEFERPDNLNNLIILISSPSVTVAYAALAVLVPLKPGQTWLRNVAIGAAIAAAIFLNLKVTFVDGHGTSLFGLLAAAAAIVASCGSLALIISACLHRPFVLAPVTPDETAQESLPCPRCGQRLSPPVGTVTCPACRLTISTTIEETTKHCSEARMVPDNGYVRLIVFFILMLPISILAGLMVAGIAMFPAYACGYISPFNVEFHLTYQSPILVYGWLFCELATYSRTAMILSFATVGIAITTGLNRMIKNKRMTLVLVVLSAASWIAFASVFFLLWLLSGWNI